MTYFMESSALGPIL